ncbi:MAG: trypsin-like peptidase domain-containing protein [Candidatus Omnitrophica bacterium]|nr:trypsin-like peptidase domain-containing protein [Candidatus Omnitrophota bacterium]
MPDDHNDEFCNQSIRPWILGLVGVSVMSVLWVVLKRQEIFTPVEFETPNVPKAVTSMVGEPSFPRNVMPAAMAVDPNLQRAGLTKATPNGGMQLVAAQVNGGGFQDSLKDAVNSIIPTVCDIHARRIPRAARQPVVDAQNLKFVPPFDGVIDKFIANKGYEKIGSGVFVDDRGYILTNYHVTQDATDVMVTVFGTPARDYPAEIVAQDANADLALLKLKTTDGPFVEAKIGDSSWTQVGDYVVAVGSPFGIEQTVTSGIISGNRKSMVIDGVRYKDLFQTDASINRGSSGGPLVNMKGEVIGINTAIYAPTGVFSGTGFAIPINNCKDFLSANLGKSYAVPLDKKGLVNVALTKFSHLQQGPVPVHFGIEVMAVDSIIAKQYGIPVGKGVLVNRILDGSPAAIAGIMRGDIILSVAGVEITETGDIPKVVTHFKAGDNVNVRLLRNGKADEVLVKLQ